MYCENCGARIDDDSKFCENCGVLVEPDDLEAESKQDAPEKAWGSAEEEQRETELQDLNQLMEMDEGQTPIRPNERTMVFSKSKFIPDVEKEELPREEEPEEEASFGLPDEEVEKMSALISDKEKDFPIEAVRAALSEAGIQQPPEAEDLAEEDLKEEEPEAEPMEELPEEYLEEEPQEEELPTEMLQQEPLQEDTQEEASPAEEEFQEEEIEEVENAAETEGAAEERPLFCMACGRRLPTGAAFCDACGTPTGQVAPAAIHKIRAGQSKAVSLLRSFFQKPAETIEKAAGSDTFLSGIAIYLGKDLILAILAAVFMKTISQPLGIFGGWLVNGNAFLFGAKIFLCAIVLDALWLGILFGAGFLFRAGHDIKTLTGACGTANLLTGLVLIVAMVVTAFVPSVALCAAMIAGAVFLLVMGKAAGSAMKIEENMLVYVMSAVSACYLILLFALFKLMA